MQRTRTSPGNRFTNVRRDRRSASGSLSYLETHPEADTSHVAAEGIDESTVPQEAYVPTAAGGQAAVPSASQGYMTGPGTAAAAGGAPGQPGQGNKTVFDAGAQ